MLMIAAVALVFAFGSSSGLAAAYGVGVATIMVITNFLLYVVVRERWGWGPFASAALVVVFLAIDLVFFAANITKIPAGGWVPLAVGVAGFSMMATWRRGRVIMAGKLKKKELPIERLIASIVEHPQQRVPGTGVYLFGQTGATPPTLLTNLRHFEVLHETVVLVSVATAARPRVPRARRSTVHDLGNGFIQVVLHYGFYEEPDVPTALTNIVDPEFGFDPTDATFFIGKESVLVTEHRSMAKWREHLFAFMHRNSGNAASFFHLPHDQVVEVGVQVPI